MAPARTFLGWDAPALPLAADLLLDHYTTDGVARLDEAIVVLPGARAGRRLKEILVEKATERGVRLVPPRVVKLGRVPELLYEPERPTARPATARLTWAAALRDTPRGRLEAVFARLPGTDAPAEWAPLARELDRLHRDVARGGWRFDDVAARCRAAATTGDVRWDDADRWEVLAEVQREYEARLRGMELGDPDLTRIGALRAGGLAAPADLWLVGVPEMPGVVRSALEAVADRVHALVHAPDERAAAFDTMGCVVPDAWKDVVVPVDESRLAVRDRPDHQADEVARSLAGLDGRWAADEIVVGVADPEVIPWVEERLTAAGVPVRSAAGEKVEASGPYRALAAAADFLDGRRFESLAALARHPDVAEWVASGASGRPESDHDELGRPGGWLEPLDRWFGDHLQARVSDALPGATRRHGRPTQALVERIDEHLLGELSGTRPLGEWCRPVLQLLSTLYGHRTLAADHPADRRVLRALDHLADAVHAFDDLPASIDGKCRAPAALRLFLQEASGAAVPADPDRAAVELLGWLELHLDDAPVTVLTGVNEPRLPESAHADPFLPDALRIRLGLQDNRLRYARDAYRLTAMIHSREELTLVAGRRSATGDPLRPSRLLFACDGETAARRVRRFYEGSGGVPDDTSAPTDAVDASDDRPLDLFEDAPRRSAFELPPERILFPDEPLDSLRVTDFRQLLQDPYGFALKRYRGCEPLDDAAREMDGLVFGTLAHGVLERFGRSDLRHSEDEAAVARLLDDLLDREVADRFGAGARSAHVAVRIQIEQLRARLRRFATWQVAWVAEGWRIQAVECETADGGAPLDVDGTPVRIRARIDRVDHHPGKNRWAVFDYKTSGAGEPPEKSHIRKSEWCDLQLPLYRWLLPQVVAKGGDTPLFPQTADADVQVGYLLLPKDLSGVGDALADWGEAHFADALEAAREVIRQVRSGPFTFEPDTKASWSDSRMEALLGRGQLAAAGPSSGDDEGDDE